MSYLYSQRDWLQEIRGAISGLRYLFDGLGIRLAQLRYAYATDAPVTAKDLETLGPTLVSVATQLLVIAAYIGQAKASERGEPKLADVAERLSDIMAFGPKAIPTKERGNELA